MKLDATDFKPLPGVSADERRERYEGESRKLCSRCESGLTFCATPQACERAERAERKEPGSREIPGWLLAALLACALIVIRHFSPGAAP